MSIKPNIFKITKKPRLINHIRKNSESYSNDELNQNEKHIKRELWTEREDQILRELVNKNLDDEKDWNKLADVMTNEHDCKLRVGKQLRERWVNHLDPNVIKDYWTEMEEKILFAKQTEYGNKWSEIAKFLPGRTDNSVKNFFYSKLRRQVRHLLRVLQKNNVFQLTNINERIYNADFVYKLIKDLKCPYQTVNKSKIMDVIKDHLRGEYIPARKTKDKFKKLGYRRSNSNKDNENNILSINNQNKDNFQLLMKKRQIKEKEKKISKKEQKQRQFHHTNINIVILKKVLNEANDNYSESSYSETKNYNRSIESSKLANNRKNNAFINEYSEDSITFNNEPGSRDKKEINFNNFQINTFNNRNSNEIITPSHKYHMFQPVISPLNNNYNHLIVPQSTTNNSFNINLENFFNPIGYKKNDLNNNQTKPFENDENSQISLKNINEVNFSLKEERKPKDLEYDRLATSVLVKPTARIKKLSLNLDEINSTDTNTYFYNNFKPAHLSNKTTSQEGTLANINNENESNGNRKRMPSLGISPSSAFGKAYR